MPILQFALPYVVTGLIMLWVLYTDWKERKIYNLAVVLVLICAVYVNWPNFYQLGTSLLFSFVFFLPFWLMKGLGGGDFKIMMALGALVGIMNSFVIFLIAAIPCLIYTAAKKLIQSKKVFQEFTRDTIFALKMATMGQLKTAVVLNKQESIPLGCWLCLGYYVWLINQIL